MNEKLVTNSTIAPTTILWSFEIDKIQSHHVHKTIQAMNCTSYTILQIPYLGSLYGQKTPSDLKS